MNEEIKQAIENVIANNKIALFVKGTKQMPRCGFSAAVIQVFHELEVPFECFDIFEHPDIKPTLTGITGWPTTPQIFIDGKFIGGGDIVREMHARGELKPVVDTALAG